MTKLTPRTIKLMGLKESGFGNFRDLMRNSDANTIIPDEKPSIAFDDLKEIEQECFILIGSGSQTQFEGSKSKNSKKNQLKSAGWALESKGLVKTAMRYGGYEAELTADGQKMYDGLSNSQINSVVRISEAQRQRQSERVNGQYSEMNTCDYCCKRGGNVAIDDENDGVFICQKCSKKRDEGAILELGDC